MDSVPGDIVNIDSDPEEPDEPPKKKLKPKELEKEKKEFERIMQKEPDRITVKSANFTKTDSMSKEVSFDRLFLDSNETPFIRCNHPACAKSISQQEGVTQFV